MKKMTCERTLEKLRLLGFLAQKVEYWQAIPSHPGGGVRRDLFGCIDIVAIGGDEIVGVQAVDASGLQGHLRKLAKDYIHHALSCWLSSGGRFELCVWRKLKVKRGGKAVRWEEKIVPVRFPDLYDPDEEGVAYLYPNGVRYGERFYPINRETSC